MKKVSELKTKMKITLADIDCNPKRNDMTNYDYHIMHSLNAETPKQAFENISEMIDVLNQWKQLAEDSDMKPEDECCELYAATKEILQKITNDGK